MQKTIALTGDRPTGALHLGHYAGSLRTRLSMQDTHEQYVLVADCQALTDNASDPEKVRRNVLEVVADYLAVGIDPEKTTICLQSQIPALAEISMLYLNFVSVGRLERNPTIKAEICDRGFERSVPAGFLCYPAAQAADITGFGAVDVPVGADQVPIIEQTNEIVRRINAIAQRPVIHEVNAIVSAVGRLPGIDGKAKMSKSGGNAVNLSATSDEIRAAVRMMYTDPEHVCISDPGKVEGNVVFSFLDAFDDRVGEIATLKAQYRAGGLGDSKLKSRLEEVLDHLLGPIRDRRRHLAADPDHLRAVLRSGTEKARGVTEAAKRKIFNAVGAYVL